MRCICGSKVESAAFKLAEDRLAALGRNLDPAQLVGLENLPGPYGSVVDVIADTL